MNIQKYFTILFFGISVTSYAMQRDSIFNDDEPKVVRPFVQRGIEAQKALEKVIEGLNTKEDPVKKGSDGYWQTAGRCGPFTLVKRAKL